MKPLSKDRIDRIAKYGKPSRQEAHLLATMMRKAMRPKFEPPLRGEKLFRITLSKDQGHRFDTVLRIDCQEVIANVLFEDEKSLRRVNASVDDELVRLDGDRVIGHAVERIASQMGIDIASRLPMEKGGWRKPPRVYPVMRPFMVRDEVLLSTAEGGMRP